VSERLPTGLVVGALLRRVNDSGGQAVVLAKGDAQAGAVLIVVATPGHPPYLLERMITMEGVPSLVRAGPDSADDSAILDYWQRRRARDRDLWVVELAIADAERFAAETIAAD